ncbi:hypothetical protein PGT21_015058 [Puccinia graminis f. sp. tritici]|uniref:RanBP2-type domain-containing protein n=1 Tax=Puccinia graminis f. sp. tritici TaxID=56615 RepID=A0A5B0QZA5_PUCGR|nr:hypothetical protein PGT21_015058 [Puccinia graminis f. sp. tritici]KAA1118612.1 hypothetical protein PGTUg99_001834 [Puccinia graminis f. sp. tritici]
MRLALLVVCLVGTVSSSGYPEPKPGAYPGAYPGGLLPASDTTHCSRCAPKPSRGNQYQPGPGPTLVEYRRNEDWPCNKCTKHTMIERRCPSCYGDTAIHICGTAPV